MKYILILLLVATSINAQTVPQGIKYITLRDGGILTNMTVSGSEAREFCYVGIKQDGTIDSRCKDSLSIIKLLINEIDKLRVKQEEKDICINTSVNWANTVPDYYKLKQRKWLTYVNQLKKQNYYIGKKK